MDKLLYVDLGVSEELQLHTYWCSKLEAWGNCFYVCFLWLNAHFDIDSTGTLLYAMNIVILNGKPNSVVVLLHHTFWNIRLFAAYTHGPNAFADFHEGYSEIYYIY